MGYRHHGHGFGDCYWHHSYRHHFHHHKQDYAFGTRGDGATPLIVVGACFFYLSDLSVAALRFTEPPFPTYVLGLPLYYAAQVCLAFSIAASSNRDPSTAPRRNTPPGNR